ncbi:uncharacterized protein [Blastocystis hominis]|uniref:Uncharacterized protein n=1 Tax=Blastocystis hominis TaxID=12968 RepID=D8LWM5_BLAHO|nr:uncharacterized protein [Blastocystis hominis]CBK20214.2 unnamed protein product [Blastocystis hominis]|eukprot:XP_012894262.1 uncharacterized protein [Blastocystis hominis]
MCSYSFIRRLSPVEKSHRPSLPFPNHVPKRPSPHIPRLSPLEAALPPRRLLRFHSFLGYRRAQHGVREPRGPSPQSVQALLRLPSLLRDPKTFRTPLRASPIALSLHEHASQLLHRSHLPGGSPHARPLLSLFLRLCRQPARQRRNSFPPQNDPRSRGPTSDSEPNQREAGRE